MNQIEVVKGKQVAIIKHGGGLDVEGAEAYYRRGGMIIERHQDHTEIFDWTFQEVKA